MMGANNRRLDNGQRGLGTTGIQHARYFAPSRLLVGDRPRRSREFKMVRAFHAAVSEVISM